MEEDVVHVLTECRAYGKERYDLENELGALEGEKWKTVKEGDDRPCIA